MATIRHVRLTDKDGSSQILDVAGGEGVPEAYMKDTTDSITGKILKWVGCKMPPSSDGSLLQVTVACWINLRYTHTIMFPETFRWLVSIQVSGIHPADNDDCDPVVVSDIKNDRCTVYSGNTMYAGFFLTLVGYI